MAHPPLIRFAVRLGQTHTHTHTQSEQITDIDNTKVVLKKRSGILSFVRVFALFVDRMESLMCGTEAPISRAAVTTGYTKVVWTIFDTLAEVAQLVQNDSKTTADDKAQLNIHIRMVGRRWLGR